MSLRRLYRCPEYRLGSVSTNLIDLPLYGVPYPNEALYNEFPVRTVRGDLSMRGDGFPSVEWRWTSITKMALDALVNLTGGWSVASGAIYIRTKTNQMGLYAYRNFACSMYHPQLDGTDGTPSAQDVDAYSDVTIRFAGLVAY